MTDRLPPGKLRISHCAFIGHHEYERRADDGLKVCKWCGGEEGSPVQSITQSIHDAHNTDRKDNTE